MDDKIYASAAKKGAKICGIVNEHDARSVAALKPEFMGFVLYFPKSKRNLELEEAKKLLEIVRERENEGAKANGLAEHADSCSRASSSRASSSRAFSSSKNEPCSAPKCVAVTVSPSLEQAKAILDAGFDYIQIHGNFDAAILDLCGIQIIRAFNLKNLDEKLKIQIKEASNMKEVKALLFDAASPGSGQQSNWDVLKEIIKDIKGCGKKTFAAGGLNPDNIELALKELDCDYYDTSSGVELEGLLENGRSEGKDLKRVEKFVKMVHDCQVENI